MISVRKSPNMMSTTGRIPVIAAPSASPAMAGSEIGEAITRSGPNSSTRPDITLNGVPASATSSPMMYTVGSRRSSSASASFTACDCVITRVPGGACVSSVDIVGHLRCSRERRVERELDAGRDLVARLGGDRLELLGRGKAGLHPPRPEPGERIAVRLPVLLLVLGAVVGTVDVTDVVTVVAVGVGDDERRPAALAPARDGAAHAPVDCEHVLSVDLLGRDAEGAGAGADLAGRRLRVVRVLV